eukprot:SAG31_NODE_1092_length_9957_cov_10.569284_7_plen_45_part_00
MRRSYDSQYAMPYLFTLLILTKIDDDVNVFILKVPFEYGRKDLN